MRRCTIEVKHRPGDIAHVVRISLGIRVKPNNFCQELNRRLVNVGPVEFTAEPLAPYYMITFLGDIVKIKAILAAVSDLEQEIVEATKQKKLLELLKEV